MELMPWRRQTERLDQIEKRVDTLAPVGSRGWWPLTWIGDWTPGAWQRNDEISIDTVLAYHAVYACITLISSDIGKLRTKLVQKDDDGIWSETDSPSFSPVLRKPNRYQNHIQFKEWWITSKLIRGNAYALKQRDNRGVVTALYLLDPQRVQVLVAPDGSVFYQLSTDNLAGLQIDVTVPASEMIHDRMNCLFHPLVGTSPIYACGSPAMQGLKIQRNSTQFFGNSSYPGGVLSAPGAIPQETANRLKTQWEANFSGDKAGSVAIVSDGLKFEPMRMSAVDSQLIEQLRWTAEVVCGVFHVPAYMIGVGPAPSYNNIEALSQQYYQQCLQTLIENFELCLDEGLGLDERKEDRMLGTELDLDGLLRMDQATQIEVLTKGVFGSVTTIDEARAKLDRKRVKGGDTIWMQQQNYSLKALVERDANDPFAKPEPAPLATQPLELEIDDESVAKIMQQAEENVLAEFSKQFQDGLKALYVT